MTDDWNKVIQSGALERPEPPCKTFSERIARLTPLNPTFTASPLFKNQAQNLN